MKKLIKVNEGILSLSFEEVLERHKKLLYKSAISRTVGVGIHRMDVEDIMSEMEVTCWKCYNNYDIDKNICFSTILTKYCENKMKQLIRDVRNKQEFLSDNEEYSGYIDTQSVNDSYFENGLALIDAIAKNEKEKQIMILLSQDVDKRAIANKLNISRSGLYKTLDKIKTRMIDYLNDK